MNLMNAVTNINYLSLLVVNLYKIVVFPAPSRPSMSILISFDPHSLEKRLEKKLPVGLGIKNTEKVTVLYLVYSGYFIDKIRSDSR